MNSEADNGEIDYSFCLVDQMRAAAYALKTIADLEFAGTLNKENPHHKAILETDVFRLRRGLCLPSAASTCINKTFNKRIIGDEDGNLKIGDFFRFLLPHHCKYPTSDLPKGWLVATDQGDMYHHSIVAFAQGLGISAIPVKNFASLREFQPIMDSGGCVTVSLDNWFVPEMTLKGLDCIELIENDFYIKVDTLNGITRSRFEHGRHVVSIVKMENEIATIADSFNLPQTKIHGLMVTAPIEKIDHYLSYINPATTRGIVFPNPNHPIPLQNLEATPVVIPQEVKDSLELQLHDFR